MKTWSFIFYSCQFKSHHSSLLSYLWLHVPEGDSHCILKSSTINHLSFHEHQPSPTAAKFQTDFTLRSYGITLTSFPTFSPCHPPSLPPSLPLCVFTGWQQEKEGGLPPLPDRPALRTCGLGIIGLQLQQPSELALILRMTPFTFVWLPAASTAAAFILIQAQDFTV